MLFVVREQEEDHCRPLLPGCSGESSAITKAEQASDRIRR